MKKMKRDENMERGVSLADEKKEMNGDDEKR